MTFRITVSEHRCDGTIVQLLAGDTHVDMPTLLCAYNLELLLHGSCLDCTRFRWEDAAGDELVRVLTELTSTPFGELSPDAELRFRIEQEGEFLLETRPCRDPRPLLADVVSGSPTSDMSGLDLLGALLWDAPVVEACSYAASCGWGKPTTVLLRVAER